MMQEAAGEEQQTRDRADHENLEATYTNYRRRCWSTQGTTAYLYILAARRGALFAPGDGGVAVGDIGDELKQVWW